MNNPILEPEWLNDNLKNDNVIVFDTTVFLLPKEDNSDYIIKSGRNEYLKAHIPGAIFIDLQKELSIADELIRFKFPSKDIFLNFLEKYNINNNNKIVFYSSDKHYWATRAWFIFYFFGFENIYVLDGGLQNWTHKNYPTSTLNVEENIGTYDKKIKLTEKTEHLIRYEELRQKVEDNSSIIINALTSEQHYGVGGIHYGRKGHIKKSISIPAAKNIKKDGTFLGSDDLKEIYKDLIKQNKKIISYCGGGIAASSVLFSLYRLGYYNFALYDASMSEWAKKDDAPME